MTERSLTPSPHRSQNLERGVFSSLSALSLYKQSLEERKQVQSSSSSSIINKKSPLPKPRSPHRVRQVTKRTEKSPEVTPRSPLKVTNRGREELEARPDQELTKLQESLKSIKLLLEREKKINSRLEVENKDLKVLVKAEQEKTEKTQKNLQSLMSSNSATAAENSKLLEEVRNLKETLEGVKEHLKNLSGILVSIVGFFFAGIEDAEGLAYQEKGRVANKIKEMVLAKLEEIQTTASLDLTRQVSEVRTWLLVRNFPRQVALKKEEPEISYTVEYFDANGSLGKSSADVHSYFAKNEEEVSFHGKKTAIALYDFEGEREDDLSFYCGDTIEILEECDSGWWVGKLDGKTGSFPYNFVQVL